MSTRRGPKCPLTTASAGQASGVRGGLLEGAGPTCPLRGCRLAWRSGAWPVILLATLNLAPAIAAAAGDTYRWNDSNGNPVISDRPPPLGIPYTVIDLDRYGAKANVVSAPPPPDTGQSPTDELTPERNIQSATPNTTRIEIEKHHELCEQAKEAIFQLETFARVRITGEDGTTRFMTDQERAEQLAKGREVASANC